MANREASVRLTLKGDGFKRGMTEAEAAGKKSARSIGESFKSSLAEAGKAGFESLKNTLGKIKDVATGFLGIAGGIGMVELARKAQQNAASFRAMAFAIKSGTGEIVNWRDLQKEAQGTALQFGHSTEEVAASMKQLRDVTGDTRFARAASKTVAEVATGSHESLETMTKLAVGLNEKFGITDKTMGDTLAQVVSLGNQGGVTVDELAEKINIMGAGAKEAGISGQSGFEQMVQWLHVAHEATGNLRKGIVGVSGIIDGIATGTLRMPILQHFGYDIDVAKKKGREFDDIMGDIIVKTGGKQENLAKVFGGEQLKVVSQLGKDYREAFEGTTGDLKTKTAAGMDAYEKAITQVSKGGTTLADIQKEAAEEMNTPEMKIKTALEKLAQAFTAPAVMGAMQKLADAMPKIVDAIVSHPLITGAIVSGIPQAVAGALMQGLAKGLLSGGAGGGPGGGLPGQAAAITAAAGAAYLDATLDEKKQREADTFSRETNARNLISATKTSDDPRAARNAIRDRMATLQKQADDIILSQGHWGTDFADKNKGVEFGNLGTDEKSRERFLEAQERAKKGTAFEGGTEAYTAISQEMGDLRRALEFKGSGSGDPFGGGDETFTFDTMKKHGHLKAGVNYGGLPNPSAEDVQAANAAYAKTQPAAPDPNAGARALADAISGRELKVRVTNPDDIGKSGDKPAPGFLPRGF